MKICYLLCLRFIQYYWKGIFLLLLCINNKKKNEEIDKQLWIYFVFIKLLQKCLLKIFSSFILEFFHFISIYNNKKIAISCHCDDSSRRRKEFSLLFIINCLIEMKIDDEENRFPCFLLKKKKT